MRTVFFANWSPPPDSRDVSEWSQFEQIARAATVSTDQLDEVLNSLAGSSLAGSHTGSAVASSAAMDAASGPLASGPHGSGPHSIRAGQGIDSACMSSTTHSAILDGARSLKASDEGYSISPIMWASAEGIPHAVSNLLHSGADPSEAVEIALQHGNSRCASVLLRHRSCRWLSMLDLLQPDFKPTPTRTAILSTVAGFVGADTCQVPRQVSYVMATQGLSHALCTCLRAIEEVKAIESHLIEREPSRADELIALDVQLQLCAAGAVALGDDDSVDCIFQDTDDGRHAIEIALKLEAKTFLSQDVIQLYMARLWRGRVASDAWSILTLLTQLPLLIVVAIVPPLEEQLKRYEFYMLSTPIVRFSTAFVFDLIFASALTVASRAQLESNALFRTLLLWAISMVLWELQQLARGGGLTAYFSERFNRIDMPAAVFSLVALVCIRTDLRDHGSLVLLRPATRVLRSAAVLLLWLRVPRIFLLSSRRGPLVLMLFRMMNGPHMALIRLSLMSPTLPTQ